MRNRLDLQDPITTGINYCAAGDLDGCPADVYGYTGGRVIIGFGPATLNLTRTAAAELAQHLLAALEAAGGAQ